MQERCKSCTYSKAMGQSYPRKCIVCGTREKPKPQLKSDLSLQEKVLVKLKKHFGTSATIRNQENVIKVNSLLLVDNDLEALKSIKGMYKDIEIRRSGSGVVIILNFDSHGH